ncbi:MAG: HD domain-containing protein [Acetatifactor sp.]|nr:HD domain-containing protein [Acetatifactor sp.]
MAKKSYQVCIWTIWCILINYFGKYLTSQIPAPLWLDSVGTAIAAYMMGPVCGAIVGASVNIIYGFMDPMSFIYAITNAAVGITIGLCAKRKMMEKYYSVVTTCSLATIVATVISAPINCIFYHGLTGNVWGDGIYHMLVNWEMPWVFSAVIAEFFLDFLDKLLTLLLLFWMITIWRKLNKKSGSGVKTAGIVLAFVLAAGLMMQPMEAKAATIDYESYIQTVYGSDKGLLSGEANDIVATDDGVLWIGTYAGLYRYSGMNFEYMNGFESVKNVNCLYVDAEGRLWIGTNDDGLSVCIEEEIVNTLNETSGLPSNSVRSVVQQSDGNYFVGTSSSLAIVRLSGGMKLKKTFPEIVYAQSLAADTKNHVAAVTSSGELYVIEGEEVISKLTASGRDMQFTCCEFTENGMLYVGTDAGKLFVYTISDQKVLLRETKDCGTLTTMNSVNYLESGDVFICADNGIAFITPDGTFKMLNSGSFKSSVDSVTVDYQGNLWFSSSRLGVMKMCDSAFVELYNKYNLSENVVNAVAKWNGKLYFGTDKGLDILNEKAGKVITNELTDLLTDDRIRSVSVDSKNRLWICAYSNGVLCCEGDGTITKYNSETGVLGSKFRYSMEMKDGKIAVASDAGISFIENGKVVATIGAKDGLTNTLVLCLLQKEDGTVLAGTDGGGIAVIQSEKIAKMLTREDGLGSGVILRMVQDKSGAGVFVITSNGICYMDADGTIQKLSQFPYSNNYDLYDDGEGKLFVTGSAGIYVVSKEKLLAGEKVDSELLNYLNGLRGTFTANAWNYMDENGFWYIAGNAGVTEMNIRNYQTEKRAYRMLVKSVTLDNTVHILGDDRNINIASNVGHIEFIPEVVNYSTDDPYLSYYLEGVDDEKVVIRQSELAPIYYNNLKSGTYAFHLAIIDNNQKVVEEQVYYFIKEAQLYDKWWFKVFFFVELLFIVSWFTWFLVRLFVQRTIDLQKREIALVREQLNMGNETIMAIAKTVDAKDSNTSQHSTRVSQYSVLIAQKLGYSEEECENLRKAALLHDIGKIGIPDNVLNKAAALDDDEYATMKTHVIKGGEILKDFSLIPHVQEGAMYHHERYDGRGYMMGLKGEEIPEYARIIGISDAFDAMTANRVYRKKLPFDVVLAEIRKGRGTQFDPKMVDIFLELIAEGKISEAEIYGENKGEQA